MNFFHKFAKFWQDLKDQLIKFKDQKAKNYFYLVKQMQVAIHVLSNWTKLIHNFIFSSASAP